MHTKNTSVSECLVNKFYYIPDYQRKYTWEQKHWKKLWLDVTALLERESPHRYNMGYLIVEPVSNIGNSESLDLFNIIDGQQRMTTLIIVIAAMFHSIDEKLGDEDTTDEMKSLLTNEKFLLKGLPDDIRRRLRLKIQPLEADRDVFEFVMASPSINDVLESNYKNHRVAKAYLYFLEKIVNYSEQHDGNQTIYALYNKLVGMRLEFSTLEMLDNAQQIFDATNNSGKPLDSKDNIKNAFMRRSMGDRDEVNALYTNQWKYFESDVRWTDERIEDFLYYYIAQVRSSNNAPVKKVLHDNVTEYIESEIILDMKKFKTGEEYRKAVYDNFVLHLSDIKKNAEFFLEKTTRKLDLQNAEDEAIETMLALQKSSWFVLLWINRNRERINQREIGKVFSLLERWILLRSVSQSRNTQFGIYDVLKFLKKLDDANVYALSDSLEKWIDSQSNKHSRLPTRDELERGMTSEINENVAKVLLGILEDEDNLSRSRFGKSGRRIERGLSLEHLMPTEWKAQWDAPMPPETPVSRNAKLGLIGNMVLLDKDTNSKIKNSNWAKKIAHLYNYERSTIAKDVANSYEFWDESIISQRNTAIIHRVIELFGHADESKMIHDDRSLSRNMYSIFGD